jgi:hypothetical protein
MMALGVALPAVGALMMMMMTLLLPAAVRGDSLSFLVMGDWGGTEQPPWVSAAQVETAFGMGQLAAQQDSRFVLALGDNIYFHGIGPQYSADGRGDCHAQRFNDTFEEGQCALACLRLPRA